MGIKPLGEYIVLDPIMEEKTESGIIMSEVTEKQIPEKGKVVAYGPGRQNTDGSVTPISVMLNDVVIFRKFSPEVIKVDGCEYLIIRESELLAIIK